MQKDEKDIFTRTYNDGVNAFNCDDFEIALTKFKKAASIKNAKIQVIYNIALCYQNLNDYSSAIKTYNEYLLHRPYAYKALQNLFYIYYDLSDFSNSINFFLRCLNIHREETIGNYFKSKQFNSDANKALKFFEAILKINDSKYLYMEMVNFLEKEKVAFNQTVAMGMVIDLYKQYLVNTNYSEETEISISMCYVKMSNWDKAIYHAQKVVVSNPDSFVGNKQLGFIYYCCSQYDKSINYYRKAIELAPSLDYKLYSNLAYAYEKAKKLPEAVKQFEILLEKFKNIPAFYEIKFHTEYIKSLIN